MSDCKSESISSNQIANMEVASNDNHETNEIKSNCNSIETKSKANDYTERIPNKQTTISSFFGVTSERMVSNLDKKKMH